MSYHRNFITVIKQIYAPNGFTRQHVIGGIGGLLVGMFFGGITASGFGAPLVVVVITALVGAAIGSVVTVSLVAGDGSKTGKE